MARDIFSEESLKKLKAIKRNRIIYSLVVIALGVVLLGWPGLVLAFFKQIVGGVLLAAGLIEIIYAVWNRAGFFIKGFLIFVGACMLSVGLWIFTTPTMDISSMITTIMGVIVISSGLMNLLETITLARQKSKFGFVSAFLAILTIGAGALLVFYNFPVMEMAVRIAGGIQIYNGLSDLIIVLKIATKVREVRQEATAVDAAVSFKEEIPAPASHVRVEEPEVPAEDMASSSDFMSDFKPASDFTPADPDVAPEDFPHTD